MAKIAVAADAAVEQALTHRANTGDPGRATPRRIAAGDGWTVDDVVCTCAPGDTPFEERHSDFRVAIVLAGSFQYRAAAGAGRVLMTPGSLLLGNVGQCFECGHEHGAGDRCLSFGYSPAYFERLAADAGMPKGRMRTNGAHGADGATREFRLLRVPPLRVLSPLLAHAAAGLHAAVAWPWEELGLQLAARAVQLASGGSVSSDAASRTPRDAEARITRVVRVIEQQLRVGDAPLTLGSLASAAGLSPYHFLRTFTRMTGVTPHQYILRAKLRAAAIRVAAAANAKIVDIALDSGFGDLSNFTRAFRAEFGVSPRRYRSISHVSATRS